MRKALSLLAKAAVSGLLLYLTLRSVDIASLKERFHRIEPGWVSLSLVVLLFQIAVVALRWQQIAVRCGADLGFQRALRFSMIAGFFNQTLPSSVGGDAVRIWLAAKHANWRVATYSVLLDRVIGLVALAALVIACLPWTLALVHDPIGRGALLLIGSGSIAGGAAFVGLSWQRLRFLQHWPLTRHLAALATVGLAIIRAPRLSVSIFSLSIAVHLLTSLAAWCTARSVGAEVSLLYSLFLVPPVVLVTVVPISIAGWGVREGAMVAAFTYAGLARSDGLIISLLFGATSLAGGIIGGVIWLLTNERFDKRDLTGIGRTS